MQFTFKAVSFIGASLLSFSLMAQEQLGLRLDNFSGVSGISINPSSNGTSKFGWDVNIGGMGFFLNNNIGFLDGASVGSAASNAMTIGPADGLDIQKRPNATLRYDFYDNTNSKYFSLSTQIMGPSFVINLKSGHSFGLFTGARVMASSHDVPGLFNGYEFMRSKIGQAITLDPFKASGMAWREVGLNYAYRIGDDTDGSLTLGANVRFVSAYQAFYFKNLTGTSMARISKDSIRFDGLRAEFGATTDLTNADRQVNTNGSGIGFDIGATMTIPSSDEDKPYEWRLGASVLDMGAVTMDANTEVHRFEISEPYQIMKQRFNNLDPNNPGRDGLERLSKDITGNTAGSLRSNTFSMGMPTAISVQADYAVMKGVFVNGLLMQRIPVGEHILLRDNLFAITPRYESRWLGASMPISVVNWSTTRVGFAARLAFLTLGTDDLGSLITNSKLTGTDFYFALKFNPFKTGLSGGGGGSSRRGKAQECYRF
jgi:Family of unknown function (DUF5723)